MRTSSKRAKKELALGEEPDDDAPHRVTLLDKLPAEVLHAALTLCAAAAATDVPSSPGSLNAIREVCRAMERGAAEVIARVSLSRAAALPADLPRGLRNWQSVSLYDVPLNALEDASRLAGMIPKGAPLRAVQIIRCGLQPSGLEAVTAALARLTGLTELDLRGNCLHLPDALEALGTVRHLRHLDLSGCNIHAIAAPGLAAGLRQLRCLERLDLGNNMLSEDGIRHLSSSALPYLTSLRHLGVGCINVGHPGMEEHLAPALEHLTQLTHLDVSANLLLTQGACALARPLRKMPNLRHLRAQGIMACAEGVRALVPALGAMTSLTRLDLGRNAMGPRGLYLMVPMLSASKGLRHVDLAENWFGALCYALSSALQALRGITHLSLERNKIGDAATEGSRDGVARLAICLSSMTALQSLDLGGNPLGAVGIEGLSGGLATLHLRRLRLNDCTIGAEGVSGLSQALCGLAPVLRELDLGKNGWGAREVTALCPALSGLSKLEVLDLSDNDIGGAALTCAALPKIDGFVKQANACTWMLGLALRRMSAIRHVGLVGCGLDYMQEEPCRARGVLTDRVEWR